MPGSITKTIWKNKPPQSEQKIQSHFYPLFNAYHQV